MESSHAAADVYAIPQEFADFRDTIRQITQEKVAPRAAEIDEKAEYPHDLRRLFAEQDLFGLPVRDRVRRDRHRLPDAQHRGRGDRQGLRLHRPDAHGPGTGHPADPPVRYRGAEAAVAPQVRHRRVDAGLRAVGARGRIGPGRDDHPGDPRRGRMGDRRHEELDHQPGDRRLLRRLRGHRPRGRALGRDLGVRRRGRPARVQRRQARAQARDPRQPDRPADLRRGADPRRPSPRRRGGGVQGRDGDARPLPARRCGSGRRDRPGRDRLRRGLRQGAPPVRQADRRLPGHPVQAGRHGDPDGGGPRAALQGVREGRPGRPGHGQVQLDGQAVRLRRGDGGHGRGDPGPRRVRVRQGVPGRAHDARREDHPDLRGDERDPAGRDRPRDVGERGRIAPGLPLDDAPRTRRTSSSRRRSASASA